VLEADYQALDAFISIIPRRLSVDMSRQTFPVVAIRPVLTTISIIPILFSISVTRIPRNNQYRIFLAGNYTHTDDQGCEIGLLGRDGPYHSPDHARGGHPFEGSNHACYGVEMANVLVVVIVAGHGHGHDRGRSRIARMLMGVYGPTIRR
jgi:hypothetical protein